MIETESPAQVTGLLVVRKILSYDLDLSERISGQEETFLKREARFAMAPYLERILRDGRSFCVRLRDSIREEKREEVLPADRIYHVSLLVALADWRAAKVDEWVVPAGIRSPIGAGADGQGKMGEVVVMANPDREYTYFGAVRADGSASARAAPVRAPISPRSFRTKCR